MPGFILHMLHGTMYLKQSGLHYSAEELKQFQMGLLIPDVNKVHKRQNDESHFFSSDQKGKILKVPDVNNFKYRKYIDQPFVLGYAAHLYLDKFFFEEYFKQYVNFLDEDGQATDESDKIEKVYIVKSKKYISVDELFSEDYLYGDYTMLNQYLVKKYHIKMVEFTHIDNPIKEVDIADFGLIQKSLEEFLKVSSGEIQMNIFTIESLENAIERYAFGFNQWTEGIKSALRVFR